MFLLTLYVDINPLILSMLLKPIDDNIWIEDFVDWLETVAAQRDVRHAVPPPVVSPGSISEASQCSMFDGLLYYREYAGFRKETGRRAYVLVNNRAEGNAPLTVEGLVGMLRG